MARFARRTAQENSYTLGKKALSHEQPERVPRNIRKRPVKLSPMRRIKDG